MEFEGDIAEAQERADQLDGAIVRYACDITKEGSHLGAWAFAIEGKRPEDAEAGAAEHPPTVIARSEGEGDVVDTIGTAHVAHRKAHPRENVVDKGGTGDGALKAPARLANAHAFTDQAFDATVDRTAAEERHVP